MSSVWNLLKPNLRSIDSSASYISQLKTTLFLSAYGSMVQSHPALLIRFSTLALYKLFRMYVCVYKRLLILSLAELRQLCQECV